MFLKADAGPVWMSQPLEMFVNRTLHKNVTRNLFYWQRGECQDVHDVVILGTRPIFL